MSYRICCIEIRKTQGFSNRWLHFLSRSYAFHLWETINSKKQ